MHQRKDIRHRAAVHQLVPRQSATEMKQPGETPSNKKPPTVESQLFIIKRMKATVKKLKNMVKMRDGIIAELRTKLDQALTKLAAQKQSAWLISGPSSTSIILSKVRIEPYIEGICKANGDDPQDYTATKILIDIELPRESIRRFEDLIPPV